jgi:DNA-binding transcriptional ArsR family regulator
MNRYSSIGSPLSDPAPRPSGGREVLPDDELRAVSEIFRLLGEPTRLRILHLLSQGELRVNELALDLGMSPSAVSHQLRLLRALRLVRYRKEGREVHYAVDDHHIVHLMVDVLSHLRHGRSTA